MRISNGWLTDASLCRSPNFNLRPPNTEVSLVVVHNISLPPGDFGSGYIHAFFQNTLDHDAHPFFEEIRDMQVSAHCLIDRSGQVTQFVSFLDRAWHAGRSCFDGVEECNDYSIGIELEGTDDLPYSAAQYRSLSELVRVLMLEFPAINASRITGHADIAPGRKTDPGPSFDWHKLHRLIKSH